MKQKRLVVIDGSCLVVTSYFATEPKAAKYIQDVNSEEYLSLIPKTPNGKLYKNAVNDSIHRFNDLIKRLEPSHLIVAWDPTGGSFRNQMYPDYKGNRKEKSIALKQQIITFQRFLATANIPQITVDNFEADDVAGTISKLFYKDFEEILLVTNDRDYLQLVNDRVNVLVQANYKNVQEFLKIAPCKSIGNSQQYCFDNKNTVKVYGVEPHQVVDFKAIAGDSGDNIKGILGVGEETAKVLLKLHGNLRKIQEAVIQHKENSKELIERWKQAGIKRSPFNSILKDIEETHSGRDSYRLAKINTSIPLTITCNDLIFENQTGTAMLTAFMMGLYEQETE